MSAPIISKQDETRTLRSISKHTHAIRNKSVFMLGLYAGFRAKEIASLKINDVFEEDGTVKASIMLTTSQAKGSKSRTVPISDKLAQTLTALKAVLNNTNPKAALIQSQKGSYFSANTITQLVGQIFDRANLSDCTAHSLRRAFITRLANNAVNLRAVQKLVGHSSLQTTQLYIDVMPEQLANAVNGL